MSGHLPHSSDHFDLLLPTGKYYPPIYEKRHGPRIRRETEQTTYTIASGSAKVDLQVRGYVTESLRALLAKDETRRRMLQYARHPVAQQAPTATEVSAKVVFNHGAGILHVIADVKQKIYPSGASRNHPMSPKLQPQSSSGIVTPLELDAATVS